ncbi:MAG: mechanosensitive ion channel [Arcanobacterium sp.]|nr:mechanosensitive ion channel [Arcanobacterium sp.]
MSIVSTLAEAEQDPAPSDPTTTEQALQVAGDAVEVTVDVLQFILAVALGGAIAFALGLIVFAIVRTILARRPGLKPFTQKVFSPFELLLIIVGAWFGFAFIVTRTWPIESAEPDWVMATHHAFLVAVILGGTWLVSRIVTGIKDILHHQIAESSARRALRVQTQMQILHRVILLTVWILGIAGVVLTFPGARAAGVSLLASAGLVSVVAGLAAQSVLGNIFAGLQLAFSDSIRVGDLVQYDGQTATVEEITLTYVVLSIWDGRRVIVPSSLMTTQSFENWTRRAPEMMGTVEWEVDWALPIDAARKQFNYLLSTTDLWNGEVGVLQIGGAVNSRLTLKAQLSAKDYGSLVDLQNYIRERMVQWIQREAPQAMPHLRTFQPDSLDFEREAQASEEAVIARVEAEKPVVYEPASAEPSVPSTGSTQIISPTEIQRIIVPGKEPHTGDTRDGYIHEAISSAVSRSGSEEEQTAKVRRVSAGIAFGSSTAALPQVVFDADRSPGSDDDVPFNDESDENRTTSGHESALFSGSPAADARRKSMEGPGEEVYLEREERLRKAEEARSNADEEDRIHGRPRDSEPNSGK